MQHRNLTVPFHSPSKGTEPRSYCSPKEKNIQAAHNGDNSERRRIPRPFFERIRGALADKSTSQELRALHLIQAELRPPFKKWASQGFAQSERVACFFASFFSRKRKCGSGPHRPSQFLVGTPPRKKNKKKACFRRPSQIHIIPLIHFIFPSYGAYLSVTSGLAQRLSTLFTCENVSKLYCP